MPTPAPLGRRIRPAGGTLRIFPHAFRGQNAFYDPELRSVLFGYFAADLKNPGANLPGGPVFTCLSHDVIAHETFAVTFQNIGQFILGMVVPKRTKGFEPASAWASSRAADDR